MKPVIGVIPLWDDEKDSIWMLPGYMDGISEAGGLPMFLPNSITKSLWKASWSIARSVTRWKRSFLQRL